MSSPHPPLHAEGARATRRSIRLMVLSMVAFTLNDTLVKLASETLPTGQVIFLRGVLATAFVLLAVRLSGATLQLRPLVTGWVALRAVIDAFSTLVFLLSLFHLPLATATAIGMAAPLVIAALAAWWLGERVSPARWALIGTGFVGVLLVIQPGPQGFNAWAWLCLGSTVLTAVRDIVTRRIPPDTPSIGITLSTAVAVTLLALVVMAFEGWRPMEAREWALLTVAAMFLATGYQLLIRSTRSADLSVVAPFRYVCLLMALVLGWTLWGYVPNALAWTGIALIIGTGVVLLRQSGR
jgi:drug/metabolite transporter (DMT)-like permease